MRFDLEAAYQDGYQAFLNQVPQDNNPYCPDEEEQELHDMWKLGWEDAGFDETRL